MIAGNYRSLCRYEFISLLFLLFRRDNIFRRDIHLIIAAYAEERW